MIAPGRYRAKGMSAGLAKTGNGNYQVGVLLNLLETNGETITWYGFLTDETVEKTIEQLRTLGWQTDDLRDLTGIDLNEVSVVIEHETYEGKTRPKAKWINAPNSIALKNQLSDADAAVLSARMKGKILAMKQKPEGQVRKAAATAPAAAAATGGGFDSPPPQDDDIPF